MCPCRKTHATAFHKGRTGAESARLRLEGPQRQRERHEQKHNKPPLWHNTDPNTGQTCLPESRPGTRGIAKWRFFALCHVQWSCTRMTNLAGEAASSFAALPEKPRHKPRGEQAFQTGRAILNIPATLGMPSPRSAIYPGFAHFKSAAQCRGVIPWRSAGTEPHTCSRRQTHACLPVSRPG